MQTKRSVIRNTALSYAGQAYTLLVGILIMPFYLGHMGAEAYGLIGFFSVLQAWLQLLDAGLSPSLVRAVAHRQGSEGLDRYTGRLLRSFEIIFLPLAGFCCVAMYAGSEWIAVHWLNAQQLSTETLVQCIGLMGIVIALRLFSTLYKSGIQGLEQHAWLNIANVIIATLRYFGGLLLVSTISNDPVHFFEFQALVGLIEAVIFAARAYQQMPTPSPLTGFDWDLVKPIIPFAASMSGTAVLWIVLTQIDKVLLSELLPRLTVLMAEGRRDDMHQLYLAANRFVCTFLFPLAALIALHADEMVFAWSGDRPAADWSRTILPWYSLGSAIMAVSAFQFYLQYAYGRMHLHVWYSIVSALITVPVMFLAIRGYGAYGAAIAWFVLRVVSFAIWPVIVHQRLAPGIHSQWLRDIIRISVMTGVGLAITEPLLRLIANENRISIFLGLAVSGLLTLLIVAASYKPLVMKISVLFSKPSV